MRFFNTEGPIKVEHHYSVPPLSRIDLDEVLTLIGRLKYFVLHAPKQSGKTTLLGALLDSLNRTGRYRCVYVNVEIAQAARETAAEAMRAILEVLSRRGRLRTAALKRSGRKSLIGPARTPRSIASARIGPQLTRSP